MSRSRTNRNFLPISIACTIVLCIGNLAAAQDQPYKEVSIASPTAASLGKYADIPVHYHTGIPQISIPIYTIKSGTLELPISLSYHASGLKVMEPASWVGAGWTLNAGGVITRTVMGAPDEKGTSTGMNNTHGYFSDNGYNKFLYNAGMQDWQGFAQGRKDGEPDLFFYNFGGYSGKFYFNDDGAPIVIPESDIRIQSSYSPGAGQSIKGFTITTPDGTKYFFGRTDETNDVDPIEITSCYTSQTGTNSGTAISSWYLNKIQSADGLFSIKFTYKQESYGYPTISIFPIDAPPGTPGGGPISPVIVEYNLVRNIIQGVRLDSIIFANGAVSFEPGNLRTDLSDNVQSMTDNVNQSAKSLAAIKIASTDQTACKKFVLSTSYFAEDENPLTGNFSTYGFTTDKKRLRLDKLQEVNCDQSMSVPPHLFEYEAGTVPRRLSFAQDHWGFYNGVNSNTTLIPTYTIVNEFKIVPGANRDAVFSAMKGGVLKKITYPTGGFTEFEFESNSTWINFSKSEEINRLSASAGFDGSSNVVTNFVAFGGNSVKVKFTNSAIGAQATLKIYNSSDVIVGSWLLEPGQSFETRSTYAAGTYKVELQKLSAATGSGAEAKFDEWSTTSVQKNETVGGLRIKSLISNDGRGSQNHVTNYSYISGPQNKSTGILYGRPTYVQTIRNDLVKDIGYWDPVNGFTPSCSFNGCTACDGSTTLPYYRSGGSIRPMGSSQGNHIGYNEVKVSQSGNGYSIYRYYGSNLWDLNTDDIAYRSIVTNQCDANTPNYPSAPLPFEFMRGELKYEGHFKENGDPVKEINYTPLFENSAISTPGFVLATRTNGGVAQTLGTFYTINNARKVQSTVAETIFDATGSHTTTTTSFFNSSFHRSLSKKTVTDSKGLTKENRYTYAFDFRVVNCDAIADGVQQLTNDNSACLAQYNTTRNSCAGNSVCLTNAYSAYLLCKTNSRNSYVDYRKQNFTDPTNNFNSCIAAEKGNADGLLKPILELKDQFYNAPMEVADWSDGKLLASSFSQFDYGTNPSTAVYLKTVQRINPLAPSTSFSPAIVNNHSVSKDSRYQNEVSLSYSSGNLTQLTKKDGITDTYLWDYQNSYPIAKVVNSQAKDVAYTSFESDGSGNWNISTANIQTTSSITGRKSYNLVNGNISLPNNTLTPGKKYKVSYWSRNGSHMNGDLAQAVGRTINGWTYFEHLISANTNGSLQLAGTGSIDELRIYPEGAQVTTYSYEPLIGLTSSADPNGEITSYEYDGLNRLKNIKDYQGNIVKNFQYNYRSSCGSNCFIYSMQTFSGSNTIGYPVGVFSVNGTLIDTASDQIQYILKWNSNSANQQIGTLSAGSIPMQFNLSLNANQLPPAAIVGCRYYQMDIAYTYLDGIRNNNGAYVDFGDGTSMKLGIHRTDTSGIVLPLNTTMNFFPPADRWNPHDVPYFIHTYPSNDVKTITIYHNDGNENPAFDNVQMPATSLTRLSNFRGNFPQYMTSVAGSSYQSATAWSVANISNWSSINTVSAFGINTGDGGQTLALNLGFAQDFMSNNKNLQSIFTSYGTFLPCLTDPTFKISRLKSDWNTYFTNLKSIQINDDHWNREDLSALTQLNNVVICAGTVEHGYNGTAVPIPSAVIDNILIQVAAGAGQYVQNGLINIIPQGTTRTSASDVAVNMLKSKGWNIYVGPTLQ